MKPSRLTQLLLDRATHDLSVRDRDELQTVLREHPEWDDDGFELAAARLDLAMHSSVEPVPDHVRQRLAKTARSWLESR